MKTNIDFGTEEGAGPTMVTGGFIFFFSVRVGK